MKPKTLFTITRRPGMRAFGLAALMLALCAGLISPVLPTAPVSAQDDGNRRLTVGDVVTATLDSDTFTQVFSVSASQGDTLTVNITTDVEALAPTVIMTDQRGGVISQDSDLATATTANLTDVSIPTNGIYSIIVSRGSGAEGDASGTFTLRLSGTQQVSGQTVTLENGGIDIELVWNAAVDFNIEVRDPVGGTVHAFSPGSPSGGTLDANVNEVCETATADSPTEVIAWPAGQVPAGSYEIIIYYIDGCDVGGPQVFTLNSTVNGDDEQSLSGTLNPGQRYLARVVIEPDGNWRLDNGGVNAGLDVNLFNREIATADLIAVGSTVSGTITNSSPGRAYSFEAVAGTTVQVNMNAQSGSLDTYLALLGPENGALLMNDDATAASTDAGFNYTIPSDGTYTILATRYGLTIGGTEGEYTLSLTSAAAPAGTDTQVGTAEVTGTEASPVEALPQGNIEVALTWQTNADLQLSVRDPFGETVYDDQPTIRSGGVLAADGNRSCLETTVDPISYVYWPENRLTAGTYEIEVWYQSTCDDQTPVTFNLAVNVGDQTIINTDQPAQLASRYMITFTVNDDLTATAGPGGFFNMESASTLNYQSALDSATQISYGQTVSGSITESQRFVVYAFDAVQGDTVSIGMEATGGTLDPTLYLVAPDGTQVDFNDDISTAPDNRNRNSAITDRRLDFTGTYYILATHYGLSFGGTTGTYTLSLVQE